MDLELSEKKIAFGVLSTAYPPRRMELANFRVEKNVNISQEKLGSRVVQVGKFHVHSEIHVYNPQ